MNTYQTYIFDLDGTLLDTLGDLHASCNYALRSHGLPQRSLDEVRQFVGNGVKKLMQRAIPDDLAYPSFDFEDVYQTFRQHYLLHSLDTTHPYPGIMEMLQELREQEKNIAVVSNKFYTATQELCEHFFGDLVPGAIGEREGIRRKPSPDTVLEALRQLNAPLQDAVYIGDSDVDIETAHNCGIPCISVLWGFRDKKFLLAHGADIFIHHPMELITI